MQDLPLIQRVFPVQIFLLLTVFGQLCQQIMPHFVTQRSLYEIRERPSKTYSWIVSLSSALEVVIYLRVAHCSLGPQIFMLANILVELPWNTIAGVVLFFCWYYPIGLYRNAVPTDSVHERGALMFLLVEAFLWFTSTFAQMVIAGIPTAETAGNIGNLIFSLSLIFCGVLVQRPALGWWIVSRGGKARMSSLEKLTGSGLMLQWMYYISPFTWLVEGMLTTGIAGTRYVFPCHRSRPHGVFETDLRNCF